MSLTFGDAKKILAPYHGKGGKIPTAEGLNQFTIKALQYLLISGSTNNERVYRLFAVNGMFTAPFELETPLKAKINGRVANVHSKWFEFRSGTDFGCGECYEGNSIFEDANTYYTVYDLPLGGAQVAVIGTSGESDDAHIIIQGKDPTGREIYTNHKGDQVAGEYLSIRKNVLVKSNVIFGSITGIVKSKTNGYVQLHWLDRDGNVRGFLSDYPPIEERPSYRRFRLATSTCPALAEIMILGRTRIKHSYADEERIPFDNLLNIELAGQVANSLFNKELEPAQAQDQILQQLVTREATYVRPTNGNSLEMFHGTSAGLIKGIV